MLDLAAAELRRDEVAIALTPLEVRVLRHLHAAAGRTVTRQALGAAAWGTPPEGRAVDHVIARLRARIEPDPAHPRFLLTVRGQGFRFGPAAPPEPAPASSSATAPPARAGVAFPAGLLDLAGGRMVRATGEVALTRTERALLAYLLDQQYSLLMSMW